jgi:16S rRNA (cytosine1402-N4)-methyltransferase
MTTQYHIPVLLESSVQGLNIRPGGVYVDLTFGGGGHSSAILEQIGANGRLIAFDQDADAWANAPHDERFTLVRHNFRFLENFPSGGFLFVSRVLLICEWGRALK